MKVEAKTIHLLHTKFHSDTSRNESSAKRTFQIWLPWWIEISWAAFEDGWGCEKVTVLIFKIKNFVNFTTNWEECHKKTQHLQVLEGGKIWYSPNLTAHPLIHNQSLTFPNKELICKSLASNILLVLHCSDYVINKSKLQQSTVRPCLSVNIVNLAKEESRIRLGCFPQWTSTLSFNYQKRTLFMLLLLRVVGVVEILFGEEYV